MDNKKCTRVADRVFPEIKVTRQQTGDFGRYVSDMKYTSLLIAVLFYIAGCDGVNLVDSNSSSAPTVGHQPLDSRATGTTPDTGITPHPSDQLEFNLSDAATTKVRAAMASVPGGTHLVVFVDVDDEKYCTGFHYNLEVQANPSESRFAISESNGIKLAIEKDDIKFLNGTTLDYATLASGTEGFVFRNPNENVSLPGELRKEQQAESRSTE